MREHKSIVWELAWSNYEGSDKLTDRPDASYSFYFFFMYRLSIVYSWKARSTKDRLVYIVNLSEGCIKCVNYSHKYISFYDLLLPSEYIISRQIPILRIFLHRNLYEVLDIKAVNGNIATREINIKILNTDIRYKYKVPSLEFTSGLVK